MRALTSGTGMVAMNRVVIATNDVDDAGALLEQAVTRAGLWDLLAGLAAQKPQPRILIKPDLERLDRDAPTGTDPALVEHLIDLLWAHGHEDVVVAAGVGAWRGVLDNRDVLTLAELSGYRFQTSGGHPYDVLDLAEDLVAPELPADSILGHLQVPRAWLEADVRIGFAKNKTDARYRYALGVHNLLDVARACTPVDGAGRARPDVHDVAVELVRRTPVTFAIIDAITSSHGADGSRRPRPLATRAIIAGRDLLATDWAGAMKMGLDPYASPLTAAALRACGSPRDLTIDGDLGPYEGWINVHPLLSDALNAQGELPAGDPALEALGSAIDTALFPFKDLRLAQVHRAAQPLLGDADRNPLAFYTAAWGKLAAATAGRAVEAWRTMFAKDQLARRDVPVGFDPGDFAPADYEAVVAYMRPIEVILEHTPPDANGLRWRYLDGSVIFRYARVVPAPYHDFVAHVPIAESVQIMNDYLGGASVPVRTDDQGRVTHQATRTIYLPQPNFMVLYGGKPIDVSKLEVVLYRDGWRKVLWRTVASLNGSAELDDGAVTFVDRGGEGTEIVIVARQKFALPLFWQVFDLDLVPAVKDYLVAETYQGYFARTIANFEARYEGRTFRIGRTGAEAGPGAGEAMVRAAAEGALDIGRRAGEAAARASARLSARVQDALDVQRLEVAQVDGDGFRHFEGASVERARQSAAGRAAPVLRAGGGQRAELDAARPVLRRLGTLGTIVRGLARDLGEAVRKDLGLPERGGSGTRRDGGRR
jgi:uncharacterized protein (DUF362 family)